MRTVSIAGGLAAVAAVALMAAGCGGSDDQANCNVEDALYASFQPPSGDPAAFTMGIRVNKSDEVSDLDGEIGDRIEERDVFVINTEFAGSSPSEWDDTLTELKDKFPCNRVAALNGLGTDSQKPGYMKALAGESELDAILLDWEPDTYERAGHGNWSSELEANLPRIRAQMRELASELKDAKTRMGLVPDYLPPWDYGMVARELALANYALDPGHHGYQVVQTQPNCDDPGAVGPLIAAAAEEVRREYRPLFGYAATARGWTNVPGNSSLIERHLGFEVAFSTSPNPNASEPVERIGPEEAARCSQEIVEGGDGAILYWADPSALKAMLDTETGKGLRPSGS